MSGFTPGPWEIHATIAAGQFGVYEAESDQYTETAPIAVAYSYRRSNQTAAANARLIAAAPVMLAMLERIIAAHDEDWDHGPMLGMFIDDVRALVANVRSGA